MSFLKIKNEYNEARTEERNKISRYFREQKDFNNEKPAVRAGVKKYTSGGRLEEAYNLSNWKWVVVKRGEVNFLISLQAFDRDPNTGNLHVLMDRIGIYAYVGEYSAVDAQKNMLMTNLELPMDSEKLQKLSQILCDLSECEIYKLRGEYEKVRVKHGLI